MQRDAAAVCGCLLDHTPAVELCRGVGCWDMQVVQGAAWLALVFALLAADGPLAGAAAVITIN